MERGSRFEGNRIEGRPERGPRSPELDPWDEIRALVNSLPVELCCILAHQSDQLWGQDTAAAVLDLYPDDPFRKVKRRIKKDPEALLQFATLMFRRLSLVRRFVNYNRASPNKVTIQTKEGVVWSYESNIFQPVSPKDGIPLILLED